MNTTKNCAFFHVIPVFYYSSENNDLIAISFYFFCNKIEKLFIVIFTQFLLFLKYHCLEKG